MEKFFRKPISELEMSWLNNFESDNRPISSIFMDKFLDKVNHDFEGYVKSYLYASLHKIGYEFLDDDEFLAFLKTRVHLIAFTEAPLKYHFYLDFKDEMNKGKFLGEISRQVTISQDAGMITATMSNKISRGSS